MKKRNFEGTAILDDSGGFDKALKMWKNWQRKELGPELKRREFSGSKNRGKRRRKYLRLEDPRHRESVFAPFLRYVAEKHRGVTLRGSEHREFGEDVVSTVCLIQVRGTQRFLLSADKKKQIDGEPLRWCIPGGSLEAGENVPRALLRELREEIRLNPESWRYTFIGASRLFEDAWRQILGRKKGALFLTSLPEVTLKDARPGRKQIALKEWTLDEKRAKFYDPQTGETAVLTANTELYLALYLDYARREREKRDQERKDNRSSSLSGRGGRY
jgi:8-oxo-dGTP pyrophosphatase MutT (NUDIX family)